MTADPKKAARAALYVARKTFAAGGDVTDNPNFQTWFGDSALHDNGVPRTYYTGTSKDKDFTSFNVGRHGAWFTTDPKEASQYAMENDSQGHVWEGGGYKRTNTASRVIPAHLKASNPYTGDRPEHIRNATNYKKAQSDWFDQLRVAGHDAWVPASMNGNLAVMLKHPTQIKSAIGNNGNFDPKSPHIAKATGGATDDASPAVAELKHLLTMHRNELRSMKGRTQYAAIDAIMKRISREHGIAPSKLHDDWMSVYHQTPDAWVAGDHGNVVDHALKMTSRGGYAFGGGPAGPASATGAPINFAPAAGAFTGLPSPGSLNLAPSKATMAAILASRPTTHTGSGKPVELSRYTPPAIAAPTFNASLYNLPKNEVSEGGQGGSGDRWHPNGGGAPTGGTSEMAAAAAAAAGPLGGGYGDSDADSAARGGRIHRADGGEIPQEILNRIVSPFSSTEEQVKKALEIAQGYKTPIGNVAPGQTGAYYSIKHPMGASEVSTKIKNIPGVSLAPKREMSWEDLYQEGKGGSFINVGGDRSNLGRLTHINNKKLAWPIDLHAGAKYMMEPNPGSVWANNISHATGFRNAILRAAEKGPVYGVYAPMGPMSVDSSHNMFDAVMSQIPGSNISKESIQKFNDDIKEARHLPASYPDKERVKEIMGKWPGLENPKEASLFARGIGGVHRAAIIKHMDKASWHKLGFPAIGMTRAAITDPEVFNAPGNVIGHRVVKFNPENIVGKETAMPHSTYTHPTSGEYVGDIPFVQRHYAMPDVIEQIVRKTTNKGEAIHPYSIDPLGRATFRKMTEENKQIQPINQRMLDSTQLGLKRQSDYGLKNGGSAKSLVDIALNLTKGKK